MSEPKRCQQLFGFCKRGHPKTRETTFERTVTVNGKLYIVRECRICHSERNSNRAPFGRPASTSKWKRYLANLEEAQ